LKRIKEIVPFLIAALIVLAIVGGGISWDVYRWKTFREETNSDVGYFKWRFVIEGGNGSVRARN
jgi:hypothetical protein